jgi:hypothetical protein
MNRKPAATRTLFLLCLLMASLAGCRAESPEQPATLTGGVFFDCNRDGACGEGDCGIENITVRLYQGGCNGTMVQTAKTDDAGSFQFSGLEPGDYCVFMDAELDTCGYGGNFPTNAISRKVSLSSGEVLALEQFGLTKLGGETAQPGN